MKISSETFDILNNFANINKGIYFKAGQVISTISPSKNIFVEAKIDEVIPQDFAIYDLNRFLSVISLFKDDVKLEFDSKNVIINGLGGRSKIKYRTTSPEMVLFPSGKYVLPSVDVKFTLKEEDFNWIMKSANVLKSPHIVIDYDGNEVSLITCDMNNDSSHINSISIPNVELTGNKFKLIFKTENWKILPGNYVVEISSKGISKFSDHNKEIYYYITLLDSSSYE